MAQVRKRLGATDGKIRMPDGSEHYIFGFVDITGVPDDRIFDFRGKAQLLSPLIEAYQGDEVFITLTNLGMSGRPDLDDGHTIHWHGFPNQIPVWDGVPEASMSVPVARDLTYYYRPLDPGTYMYHCHFEPVEHIQMGMVGPLIVRPEIERRPQYARRRFAYNYAWTEFDREFLVFLTEMDSTAHRMVKEAQPYDWTEYRPDYYLINGRAYPDTVRLEHESELPFQPYSARITAYRRERVLLRFVNLGFQQHSVQVPGISLTVIARDAQVLRGAAGEDLTFERDTVYIAPGETLDALFTAPVPGTYPLYCRNLHRITNAGVPMGGMITEVVVRPRPLGFPPVREGENE